jgi:hypothetical protein
METLKEFMNGNGEKYCTVLYDEKNKWVYDYWNGMFGAQDNFRRAVVYWKDLAVKHQSPRGLTDVSQMVGSYDSSKEWMEKVIMPQVIKAGLRFHAMVIPTNVFAKLSTKDYASAVKDYTVQIFDDVEKAKAWLHAK